MLEQVDDALWIAEGENVSFYGIPYPTRSVIARLQNGDLWIWSPLAARMAPDIDQEWFRGSFAMDEIFTDLLHRDRRRPDPDLQRLC